MQQAPETMEIAEAEHATRVEHGAVPDDAEAFWSDVFVHQGGLPWRRFVQSGACHAAAILVIWAGPRLAHLQPSITKPPVFTHAQVIYYTPSEYLPPIDTRRANPAPSKNVEPEYSSQPIISLPPQADNRRQTIIAPPKLKLHREMALPNMVAWSKPQLPIAPAPVVLASEMSRLAPKIDRTVVAPPPEIAEQLRPSNQEKANAPQLAVIAPPPEVDAESSRRVGDLDIAHSAVIAPAPQLSLDEQHSERTAVPLGTRTVRVIAPPPSEGAGLGARSGVNMIALNLHPSVTAPAEPAQGNRRGSFATTPEGQHGNTGTAGRNGGPKSKTDASSSGKPGSDLPPGLYVGKTADAPLVNPNLIADARPPRISARMLRPENSTNLSEEERAVFGGRKFYSLTLNMPNLNSAGGSWVIRFAALNSPDSIQANGRAGAVSYAATESNDDLSAPSATRKVDPAYPLELMRQNVAGTVVLYAIIRSDGTVGKIRVLRSVDERLDRYAIQAIAKWQFEPARKNGSPVDVEATFWIPFRPAKTSSGF
ncbi:MAG: energy transducer TonB [Candidatus Sulfotelmatobacter sp.]